MAAPEPTNDELDAIEVALVIFDDGEDISLASLRDEALADIDSIERELRRYPGADEAVALIAQDEDFVLFVRIGEDRPHVLLSDSSNAADWTLGRAAAQALGVRLSDDSVGPIGDITIMEDLGVEPGELEELFDDEEIFPFELVAIVADFFDLEDDFDDLTDDEDDE